MATMPISAQMTFCDADGKAPCHQPFNVKPTAPTTFII